MARSATSPDWITISIGEVATHIGSGVTPRGGAQSYVADGVPLRGYFHETGIDGYEWVHGFAAPRGLLTRDRLSVNVSRGVTPAISGMLQT